MATRAKAVAGQVPGDFFVDTTCIDCGTCYRFAPEVFRDAGDCSSVHAQPSADEGTLKASLALVACPTGSIGTSDKRFVAEASRAFPVPLGDDVHFCGYTAESSFGAWSYLIMRPQGNVLVDSPRFAEPLAARIEEMGGAAWMFLTHRDDVADHAKWRERLGCDRIVHAGDRLPGVERVVEGEEPVRLAEDLLLIPPPATPPEASASYFGTGCCSAAITCGGIRSGECCRRPDRPAGTTGPPNWQAWRNC